MNRAFRTALVILACVPVLASCQLGQPSISTSNVPPRHVSLLEGAVQVPAPSGYCVDLNSLQDHRRAGFVLMAGCDGLMGLPSGTLIEPAILTVAAYVPDQPVQQSLDVAAALDGATVLERRQVGGLNMVRVQSSDMVPDDSAPEHWRGAMVLNEAVLTLAVYGNGAITNSAGAELLQVLARQITQASGKGAPQPDPDTKKKQKNLFQRIFN